MPRSDNLVAGGTVVNCSGCCTTCNAHFTSQRAFDKHRQGDYEVTTEKGKVLSENTRHCVDPNSIEGMEFYKGKCPRQPHVEVILWRITTNESEEDTSG